MLGNRAGGCAPKAEIGNLRTPFKPLGLGLLDSLCLFGESPHMKLWVLSI